MRNLFHSIRLSVGRNGCWRVSNLPSPTTSSAPIPLLFPPTVHIHGRVPTCFTVAVAAGKDMEVSHGQIGMHRPVHGRYRGRVSLFGKQSYHAGQDGFLSFRAVNVYPSRLNAVKRRAFRVLVEHHQVGTQVFLLWHGVL